MAVTSMTIAVTSMTMAVTSMTMAVPSMTSMSMLLTCFLAKFPTSSLPTD
eukprot:CAMPEP_0197235174 /NCGR_PEP_ID=MMETSP1429-20130617/2672_1 /TAXON_ID=49237 /ORGANISM="Chaetoceros  sp., Strain UNC1202" /LENGTH=49 /DNA_ID=CAMNT_0042693707 /DNA_START=172 /DNA_END=321 /DNA_ORIENTATION=+